MKKTPAYESLQKERKSLAETFPEENQRMTTFSKNLCRNKGGRIRYHV